VKWLAVSVGGAIRVADLPAFIEKIIGMSYLPAGGYQ